MSGFALIHRSLLGHPAFRNDAEAMTFAWMVLRASWKPARVRYKGKAISLKRGQLAVSVRDLAEAMDRDKAWIERLFKRLKSETMIETHTETGVSVVTICNYAQYQAQSEIGETPIETHTETKARQTQDTEQQDKQPEELELEAYASRASDDALDAEPVEEKNGSAEVLKPEHIVEAWNDLAGRLGKPSIRQLTPERRVRLKARISGYSLSEFREVLGNIERSPFLRGDTGKNFCTFDWLTKKANFQKILEGNYNG